MDEKEPDIRLRVRETTATLPIEVKVPETWTLAELEAALQTQLVGRYLRDQHARHGILLLVHQKSRTRGWETSNDMYLTFEELVEHLAKKAMLISASAPDAPQPKVVVLDVSKASG